MYERVLRLCWLSVEQTGSRRRKSVGNIHNVFACKRVQHSVFNHRQNRPVSRETQHQHPLRGMLRVNCV